MASFLKGFVVKAAVEGFARGANKRFRAARKHKGEMEIEKLKAQNQLDVEALRLMKTKQAADDKARHKAKADDKKNYQFHIDEFEGVREHAGPIRKSSTKIDDQAEDVFAWVNTVAQTRQGREALDTAIADPAIRAQFSGLLNTAADRYYTEVTSINSGGISQSQGYRTPLSKIFGPGLSMILDKYPELKHKLTSSLASKVATIPSQRAWLTENPRTGRWTVHKGRDFDTTSYGGYDKFEGHGDIPPAEFERFTPIVRKMVVNTLLGVPLEENSVAGMQAEVEHYRLASETAGEPRGKVRKDMAALVISNMPKVRLSPKAGSGSKAERFDTVKASFKTIRENAMGKVRAVEQLQGYANRFLEISDKLNNKRVPQGGYVGAIDNAVRTLRGELGALREYGGTASSEAIDNLDTEIFKAEARGNDRLVDALNDDRARLRAHLQAVQEASSKDVEVLQLLAEKYAIRTLMSFALATSVQPQSSRVSDRDYKLLENISGGRSSALLPGAGTQDTERSGVKTILKFANVSWADFKFLSESNSAKEAAAGLSVYRSLIKEDKFAEGLSSLARDTSGVEKEDVPNRPTKQGIQ